MANKRSPAQRLLKSMALGIIVDPEDEWLLSVLTWHLSTKGYIESTMYVGEWRKTVKFHHFITGTPIWEGDFVDHWNRNKLDNRRDNLRWVDGYTNRQNSDYVDAARNIRETKDGKFEVRIQRNGVLEQVGTYPTMKDAINARNTRFQSLSHSQQMFAGTPIPRSIRQY